MKFASSSANPIAMSNPLLPELTPSIVDKPSFFTFSEEYSTPGGETIPTVNGFGSSFCEKIKNKK